MVERILVNDAIRVHVEEVAHEILLLVGGE